MLIKNILFLGLAALSAASPLLDTRATTKAVTGAKTGTKGKTSATCPATQLTAGVTCPRAKFTTAQITRAVKQAKAMKVKGKTGKGLHFPAKYTHTKEAKLKGKPKASKTKKVARREEGHVIEARKARGGSRTRTKAKTGKTKTTPKKTKSSTGKKKTTKTTKTKKDKCKAGAVPKVGKGVWMFPILEKGVWKREFYFPSPSVLHVMRHMLIPTQRESCPRSTTSFWTASSTTLRRLRGSLVRRRSSRFALRTRRRRLRGRRGRLRRLRGRRLLRVRMGVMGIYRVTLWGWGEEFGLIEYI